MLLDLAESYVEQNRQADKKSSVLRGRTLINLFFENSTRRRTSFELAGKRLGGRAPERSAAVPRELQLSGADLEDAPSRGGKGRVE